MGRPTSGVIGMKLVDDDELLAMQVAPAGGDEETTALLVVSDGGFGKRTALKEYRRQGRAGYGVLTAKMPEGRGQLVGALIVQDADELFAITSSGVVIRMSVQPLRYLSRPTGGVKLVALSNGATVVAVAHNGEAAADEGLAEQDGDMLDGEAAPDGVPAPVLHDGDDAPVGSTDEPPAPSATPEDEEGPA
jgi:DNA gyrase subunit A